MGKPSKVRQSTWKVQYAQDGLWKQRCKYGNAHYLTHFLVKGGHNPVISWASLGKWEWQIRECREGVSQEFEQKPASTKPSSKYIFHIYLFVPNKHFSSIASCASAESHALHFWCRGNGEECCGDAVWHQENAPWYDVYYLRYTDVDQICIPVLFTDQSIWLNCRKTEERTDSGRIQGSPQDWKLSEQCMLW